jgi:hypothetical protein
VVLAIAISAGCCTRTGRSSLPCSKSRLGKEWVDKKTGEIKQVRYEPDADLHFEATGEAAFGTKFVLVAPRSEEVRGRIILDTEWVPEEGALGVVYEAALRGGSSQDAAPGTRMIAVDRVTAAVAGSRQPRRVEVGGWRRASTSRTMRSG